MKKNRKFQSLTAKLLVPSLALFLFTQCNDPKIEEKPLLSDETETVTSSASENQEEPVLSLTIDGIYTNVTSLAECKHCDYVVPEDATIVDGKKLNIKPGQAICLDAGIKYGHLSFVNLEGQIDKPITVAYGEKKVEAIAQNE